MDIGQLITVVLGTIGATGVLSTAVAFIAKAIANNILSKGLETHKSKLATESQIFKDEHSHKLKLIEEEVKQRANREIEHYRTEMQKELHILQVRYGKYHEKRSEVCTKISEMIAKLYMESYRALAPVGDLSNPRLQHFKQADNILVELQVFIELNTIYIPNEVFAEIDNLLDLFGKNLGGMAYLIKDTPPARETDAWHHLDRKYITLTEDILNLRRGVDTKLRTLIEG